MNPKLVAVLVVYLAAILGMAWYSRQKAVDFAREEAHRQETLGAGATPSGPRLTAMSEIFNPGGGTDAEAQARAASEAATQELMGQLSARLQAAMAAQGPVGAVEVCSEVAQDLTRGIALERGVQIRRVALRTRNPRNQPDEFERPWLEGIATSTAAAPVPPLGTLIPASAASPAEYRYLSPIYLKPQCLVCHGSAEQVPAEVRELLAETYPEDAATGFAVGELRGAVSVRVPFATAAGGEDGE